ncbi:putative DNA helicase related protein [Pyrococcus sp. ST04]|nr:putative DNA helicase related protein [Pyrococcus sp. ST04]
MNLLRKRKEGELKDVEWIVNRKEAEGRELARWGKNFELEILQELKRKFDFQFYAFFKSSDDDVTLRFFQRYYPDGIVRYQKEEEALDKVKDLLKQKENFLLYQAPLIGSIGKFKIKGIADFIVKVNGKYYLLEAKFTREEKLPHRIQAVIYGMLLKNIIDGDLEISVVTKENFPWPKKFLKFPEDVTEVILTIEEELDKDIKDTTPWITARCTTCQFEPLCLSEVLKKGDLGLLGISPGDKRILEEAGIKTIEDLAKLVEFSSNSPVDFTPPKVKEPEKVKNIVAKTGLNIIKLSRIAQAVILERKGDAKRLYIPGSGYNLPKISGYEYSHLTKVFLYVQKSPITETLLAISALIKGKAGKKYVVSIVKEPPIDIETGLEEEKRMLSKFFEELIDAIKDVTPGNEIYLHLYFYTRGQREDLVDALRRHETLWWSAPIRAILSLRKVIDWEGFSILKDELIDRHAMPFAQGLGIVPVSIQFGYRWNDNESFRDMLMILAKKSSDGSISLKRLYSVAEIDSIKEYYPVLNRDDDEIPFALFWKALKDGHREDIEDILMQIVSAMEKIEEEIEEEYKDYYARKRPIRKEEFDRFNLPEKDLVGVLMEYLALEFGTRKGQLERYYRLPLEIRGYSEDSAILKVERIERKVKGECIIYGKIMLPVEGGFKDYSPDEVLINIDEDSWVSVTPIEAFGREDPAKTVRTSPLGVVEGINYKTGELILKMIKIGGKKFVLKKKEFKCWNGKLEISGIKISAGSYLVLDPAIDEVGMSKAYEELEKIQREGKHAIYIFLNSLYNGNIQADYRINIWRKEDIEEILGNLNYLNEEQRKFVMDIEHRLVTLQGPPGTGKTSGALAPAILARAYSSLKQGKNALFIVTGLSHRAVNEALIKTHKLLEKLKGTFKELKHVELVRGVAGEEAVEAIKKELPMKNIKFKYQKLDIDVNSRSFLPKVTILFATPQTAYRLAGDTPRDLVVIDEASMIDLPMFFLATSKARGQVLLVGDHRQMQPIQVHEWELEDRKTIEEHLPFLSALNFIRFLRGELEERELKRFKRILGRDPPEWREKSKDEVLPLHRLKETYRLPQALAKLHSELFYSFDGIELRSNKKLNENVIKALRSAGSTEFLKFILDPDYPVILVVHGESSSTKVNEFEASLVEEIVRAIKEVDVGVVVPYRAQKRIIREKVNVQVDTVERFQGGEKDVIIVSMTSSDPAYLMKVMDFIYNPNRLNVAGSRAKEKLILIASRTLFTLSPRDLESFELMRPWKRFYVKMRENGEKIKTSIREIPVEVYRWH